MEKETFKKAKKRLKGKSLEELLEEIQVHFPGQWENENSKTLGEWFAVSNDVGIIAYFGEESFAFAFRLDYINSILNK